MVADDGVAGSFQSRADRHARGEPAMMGDALHRQDDVLTIVGAGPAGLSCAIALARAGRAVVLR